MSALEYLRREVAGRLVPIQEMLPPGFYLTLVARRADSSEDCDIIVTNDPNLGSASRSILQLLQRTGGAMAQVNIAADADPAEGIPMQHECSAEAWESAMAIDSAVDEVLRDAGLSRREGFSKLPGVAAQMIQVAIDKSKANAGGTI